MQLSHGGHSGTRVANSKREVINAQVDDEPYETDNPPLVNYAYAAVRAGARGEWLDRNTIRGSEKETSESLVDESKFTPEFVVQHPVLRIIRVKITAE